MPQFTLDDFAAQSGNVHLNKSVCTGGKCRAGPNVHLQNTSSATESHYAILHGLNRRVGKLYFGVEPFEPTVDAWNDRPIIFGKVHPEPRLFRKDPMAELDRINGAIVGELADSKIEITGHPKLMVKKNYTDETARQWYEQGLISDAQLERSLAAVPVALQLYEEGKLSHSSGFICPDDGDMLTGVVIPDHVLDFEETPLDQPVDRMSVILNKETEGDNVTEEIQGNTHLNEGKVMSRKNRERLKGILDGISTFFNDMLGVEVQIEGADQVSAASVPPNPAGSKIAAGSSGGCKLTQADFGDMEKSEIRKRFALDTGGGNFTDLKLPHHNVKGDVVPACVRAALAAVGGARSGEPMDLGGKKDAVVSHLEKHLEEIQNAEQKTSKEAKMEDSEVIDKKVHEETVAKLQKEKEEALAAKEAEIARLQKEYGELKAADEQAKKNKEDADWATLKKDVIPPGLVKEPADEDALRKLCKENPVEFNKRVLEARKAPEHREEGASHVSGPDGNNYLAVTRELRMATGRMR